MRAKGAKGDAERARDAADCPEHGLRLEREDGFDRLIGAEGKADVWCGGVSWASQVSDVCGVVDRML